MIKIEYNKNCIAVETEVPLYIEGYSIKDKFVCWMACDNTTAFQNPKAKFIHSFKVYTFDAEDKMKDDPETNVKVNRVE